MFLIVQNQQVILGPMPWRPTMFKNTLMDDLEIDFDVPRANDDRTVVVVNDEVKIIPFSGYSYPTINEKIQRFEGPFYNFFDDHAEGYYTVANQEVSHVKSKLKEQTTAKRWEKETSGFKLNLQGTDVWISTDRNSRTVYQNGIEGSWKFKSIVTIDMPDRTSLTGDTIPTEVQGEDVWINVTSADLASVDAAIKQHVQSAFNWEQGKIIEIDSLSTLEELNLLEI